MQLVDPATGTLRIVAQHGFGRPFLDSFETVHDQQSACGAALAAGRPVWVPDVASSPIFAATPALDAMLDAGSRAVASIPVHRRDGCLAGMISVHYRQPTTWSQQQQQQLAAVTEAAGHLLSGWPRLPVRSDGREQANQPGKRQKRPPTAGCGAETASGPAFAAEVMA